MIQDFGWTQFLYVLRGVPWTLLLTAITCLAGGLIGFFVAVARISKNRKLAIGAATFIQIVQGTPVLMLLFLTYYGVALYGINVSPLLAASIALSLFGGAYFGDIWRGSLQSVPPQQWEAASVLGLTRLQGFFLVILPQAIPISIPPTVGFVVQVVKNSAVASLIGFVELTRAGQLMNNLTFQPFQVFIAVAAVYFVICFPISRYAGYLERRQRVVAG